MKEEESLQTLKKYIYILNLFIYFWLHLGLCCCAQAFSERGATLRCGVQASHCGGFSCCGAWGLECRLSSCGTVPHGLSSCGSWALERRLSSCGAQA